MARIRTTKPEFWTDGKVVQLSPFARLLFLGSWNFALCDDGHLPDDPFGLKLKVLPADDVDPTELLDELLFAGVIVRATLLDGRSYLHIRNLRGHQKTDARWQPRCFVCSATKTPDVSPNPAETRVSLGEVRRDTASLTQTPRNSAQEGKGREGKGKEVTTTSADADEPDPFDEFWKHYPRKTQKRDAERAYRRALKRADAETILDGLRRYPFSTDAQFIPQAERWLNGDRWNDQPVQGVIPLRPSADGFTAAELDQILGPPRPLPQPPRDLDENAMWEWEQQTRREQRAERVRQANAKLGRSA